jgi:hypothetical protein
LDKLKTCTYIDSEGQPCKHKCESDTLCYWHDPDIDKSQDHVKKRLKLLIQNGESLAGFQLAGTNLENFQFQVHSIRHGCNLSHADLYAANLKRANLSNVNLKGASLKKANLQGAQLQFTNIEDANLLGTNLRRTELEQANWGNCLLQEKLAQNAAEQGNKELMREYYRLSEEIYRGLVNTSKQLGLYHLMGDFLYKELVMRRYQMPLFSAERLLSKMFDLLCGYGERPKRVIIFSFLVIIFCSLLFFTVGIEFSGEPIIYQAGLPWSEIMVNYLQCLYFSVVTFTTLGYGDYIPVGFSRVASALEAFTGSFTIALFVVVFVRKLTR